MNFYIQRKDKRYYAGTADRESYWCDDKGEAAPFRSREQAETRIAGLPEEYKCEVVR